MTTIAPPPKPQPSHEELEALIEEARRRARRRRLVFGAVAVIVLAAAGVVLGIILTQRGGGSTAAPAGYHFVQAKGPVSHARVEQVGPYSYQLVDLATGKSRPVHDVLDVWWDPKSGLERVVGSTAGQIKYDDVGQACQLPGGGVPGRNRLCFAPQPFGFAKLGFRLPVDPSHARIAGRGVLRGHRVVWVEAIVENSPQGRNKPSGIRVALDERTHKPVAHSSTPVGIDEFYSWLPDLPAGRVKFVVPDGGATQNIFPPVGSPITHAAPRPVNRTLEVLSRTPLWLGRSYQGHRLKSVSVGSEGEAAANGATLTPVPFVSFDYGVFKLKEFGKGPYDFEHGPPRGKLLVGPGTNALRRDGVLVLVSRTGPAAQTPSGSLASALALAKALRPLR
jgi:hypothetical protein